MPAKSKDKINEELRKKREEMLDMMLKKANLSKDDVIENAFGMWINNNLDLLTKTDVEKYQDILPTGK
jgi:vacuolar-type H+-ATPase subunit E/Vma4